VEREEKKDIRKMKGNDSDRKRVRVLQWRRAGRFGGKSVESEVVVGW